MTSSDGVSPNDLARGRISRPGNTPDRLTLKSIAERLGVSVTTVSRALSGKGRQYRISPKTEAAVQELAQKLKFSPNEVARGLRLQKSRTLGLIIPDVSNPFFANIIRAVTLVARERGYSLILADSQENADSEQKSIELLRNRNVEGLLVCAVGVADAHLQALAGENLPVVLVDRYCSQADLPYVTSDNVQGSQVATRHLIQHGHEKILCLQGLAQSSANEDRLQGYKNAMQAAGLPVFPFTAGGKGFTAEEGQMAVRKLLAADLKPTALFAFGNLLAMGALAEFQQQKISVPQDISLVCFDDSPCSAYLKTPMTVIRQQTDQIGKRAAELLLDWIDTRQKPVGRAHLIETELLVRNSVKQL